MLHFTSAATFTFTHHLGGSVHTSHRLTHDATAHLAVHGAAEEKVFIDRVEIERGDVIRVRKDTEAGIHGDVPQTHSVIHRGAQQKEPPFFRPAHVQHVCCVAL